MGFSDAGGSFPVDAPDIVPRKVSPQFFKVEAPSSKTGGMLSGKDTVYGLAGKEAEALGFEL